MAEDNVVKTKDELDGPEIAPVPKVFISDAKSVLSEIELPYGYMDKDGHVCDMVVLREMTGEEEDILTSDKMSIFSRLNKILVNCIEQMSSKDGKLVIKDKAKIDKIVSLELPSTDKLVALVKLRQLSLGDDLQFEVICPIKSCQKKQIATVALNCLKIEYPTDKKIRMMEVELPSGKKARVRISSGESDQRLSQIKNKGEDVMSNIYSLRVADINGSPVGIVDLKKLSYKDRNALKNKMQKMDYGIETDIEIQCNNPDCKNIWKNSIGLDQADFFFPGDRK